VRVTSAERYCNRCGSRLARDNSGARCAACLRADGDGLLKPPTVPASFWDSDQLRDALATWHIGRVIYAYRTHPHHGRTLSQETVGNWLGLTQAQLSRIENGRAPEELTKLIRYAQILGIPASVLWFALPDQRAGDSPHSPWPDALTISAVVNGRPVLLPIDRAAASAAGLEDLIADLVANQRRDWDADTAPGPVSPKTPNALTTLDVEELEHVASALNDARRYLDESVVAFFRTQLSQCKATDGRAGPGKALPLVLGILGAIQQHVAEVKPHVRGPLLGVGAEGAEFVGWLYRDLHDSSAASFWYDRAMEWAQAANDTAMQGYVLLKKSQMAYEDRDAYRVAALATAASQGPWQLPPRVRVEVLQQEARGLAMLGEPITMVERAMDEARRLFAVAQPNDRPEFGTYFDDSALLLREASCDIEAGRPSRAVTRFDEALRGSGLSRRDEGYFRARRAFACALSGEPDAAANEGLNALSIAVAVRSERTVRELRRTVKVLEPWNSRPAARQLREALRS
jgi:transcriptional regulator with XRE-family HTH domain